jgi:hypothetical protein
VVVLVLAGALRGLTALLVGLAALVVVCAAAWWFLVHGGVLRWLAFALPSPVVVIVVYAVAGQLWEVVLSVVLAAAKVAAGRAALRTARPPASPREYAAVPPAAFVIMNPRSGGGKVAKFGLSGKATRPGAEVALLEGPALASASALGVADGEGRSIDSSDPGDVPGGFGGNARFTRTARSSRR